MIHIWTDGSCNNNKKHENSGIGGWAFLVIKDGETIFEDLGYTEETTSTRMEMEAVIQSLKYAYQNHLTDKIDLHSDSAYVVNCFLEKWYIRWIEMDWYDIKNRDKWEEMLHYTKLLKIKFVKVKGHAGIESNERVDFLAGEARKYLICQLKK
jgi:ribonuclease HI